MEEGCCCRSLLNVHAAEKIGEAGFRVQWNEKLILADSEHYSDGLYGSSCEALPVGLDIHPESHVNPPYLAEVANPKIGGPCNPARADGQANSIYSPQSEDSWQKPSGCISRPALVTSAMNFR
jgi:hypothetical protein